MIRVRNSSGDRSYVGYGPAPKRFAGGADLGGLHLYRQPRTGCRRRGPRVLDTIAEESTPSMGCWTTAVVHLDVQRPHKITLVGAFDLPLRFRLLRFYTGNSGAPYTYRVDGDAQCGRRHRLRGSAVQRSGVRTTGLGRYHLADPAQWRDPEQLHPEPAAACAGSGAATATEQLPRPLGTSFMNAQASREVFPTIRGQSIELIADLFNVPEPPRRRLGGPPGHSRYPHPGAGGVRCSEWAGDLRLRDPRSQCP